MSPLGPLGELRGPGHLGVVAVIVIIIMSKTSALPTMSVDLLLFSVVADFDISLSW